MHFNRFRCRGPYTVETLPISGYNVILDKNRRVILHPASIAGESPMQRNELEYLAHLMNVHDLIDGTI